MINVRIIPSYDVALTIVRTVKGAEVIDLDMKYTVTFNLLPGVDTVIPTTLTEEPYSLEFVASDGHVITAGIGEPVISFSGGVYVITVYSTIAYNNVKLKIVY